MGTRIFETNKAAALLVAPFFYILVLPLVLVLILVNEIARLIVKCILRYNYGSQIELVEDGLDAISNFKNEGTTRNILIFGVVKPGTYSSAQAASMYQRQVLDYERYDDRSGQKQFIRPYDKLQKIMTTVYGYTCWKRDENFDVRRHFWDVPDDRVYTKEAVMELLAAFAEDMEETRPQWDWIYIHRYQDESGNIKAGTAIRFHHAYMDGLSLLLMFSRQLCVGNTPLIFDPTKVKVPLKMNIMAHIYTLLYAPGIILSEVLNLNVNHWMQNGPFPGGKKLYASTPVIDMDVFKQIRAKTKASPPNIIFKSFIMAAQEVLPADRILPEYRVGEVLPIIPYLNSDPHNTIGGMAYPMKTPGTGEVQNEKGFAAGVEAIKKNRMRALYSAQALFIYYSFRFSGRLPRVLLSAGVKPAHYALFLSNLPAFVENMSFLGAELDELSAWPPMPNLTGITLCSITYGNAFKLTANVDPSWLTREELDQIFDKIHKIMHVVAKHGCVPQGALSAESNGDATGQSSSSVSKSTEHSSHVQDTVEEQASIRSRLPRDVNSNETHKGLN